MSAPTVQRWHLRGDWFDACKCSIPCPCSWAQPPTYGDCDGVLLWHIREGNYGNTRLDGLNVAMLGSFVGNVWAEHSDAFAAVSLDERADEKQREVLQMIFGGQAGGWPATFGEIFGAEIRGMEYVPIEVFIAEDLATWSVDIPGKATATVEALTGPTTPEGARVQVHNLPGAEVGPGQSAATWGRATTDRADAYGFRWERSGNSSKYIPFEWLAHGVYCIGCCWALMVVLLAAGVMSLVWMGVIAAVVAVEKMNRHGETISLVLGGLLVVLALCLFVEPGVLAVVS